MVECWSTEISGFAIELHQRGPDDFRVVYGLQIQANLTYERACAVLGQAILHALSCEGKVDNTIPGEN